MKSPLKIERLSPDIIRFSSFEMSASKNSIIGRDLSDVIFLCVNKGKFTKFGV
jgi:hypothetical protein